MVLLRNHMYDVEYLGYEIYATFSQCLLFALVRVCLCLAGSPAEVICRGEPVKRRKCQCWLNIYKHVEIVIIARIIKYKYDSWSLCMLATQCVNTTVATGAP